jgi:uncharacterized protein YaaR (DUF327 family)
MKKILFILMIGIFLQGCASRFLTYGEKKYSTSVLGDSVQYEVVKIIDGGLADIGKNLKEGNSFDLALKDIQAGKDMEFSTILNQKLDSSKGTELEYLKDQAIKVWLMNERNKKLNNPNANKNASGVTIGNNIHMESYEEDYTEGFFCTWSLPLLTHELGHVWQHQNRFETKYSLWKVILEHFIFKDPYFYQLESDKRFLNYRFEQQGQIVEDFINIHYHSRDVNREVYEALKKLIADAKVSIKFPANPNDFPCHN